MMLWSYVNSWDIIMDVSIYSLLHMIDYYCVECTNFYDQLFMNISQSM